VAEYLLLITSVVLRVSSNQLSYLKLEWTGRKLRLDFLHVLI